MKTHSRCRHCQSRRKLNKHPEEYRVQPRCLCGARNWRMDKYRHRVELPQMRAKAGRYAACHCDGYHHPHRTGFGNCNYVAAGVYKEYLQ